MKSGELHADKSELQVSEFTASQKLELLKINDESIRVIEARMRPSQAMLRVTFGAVFGKSGTSEQEEMIQRGYKGTRGMVADTGYIGINHDLNVVLATQQKFVDMIGVSHQQLAEAMNAILSGHIPDGAIVESDSSTSSAVTSPFRDGTSARRSLTIKRGEARICLTDLHPEMASRYGFYESAQEPVLHAYAVLPALLSILNPDRFPFERMKELYRSSEDEMTKKHQEVLAFQEGIVNDMQFGSLGNGIYTFRTAQFRTIDGWKEFAKAEIALRERWIQRNVGLDAAPEIERWNKRVKLIEELEVEGISFADIFSDYIYRKTHRLPGEDDAEYYENMRPKFTNTP